MKKTMLVGLLIGTGMQRGLAVLHRCQSELSTQNLSFQLPQLQLKAPKKALQNAKAYCLCLQLVIAASKLQKRTAV